MMEKMDTDCEEWVSGGGNCVVMMNGMNRKVSRSEESYCGMKGFLFLGEM